jgi:glycosyltransferase 2 family protein
MELIPVKRLKPLAVLLGLSLYALILHKVGLHDPLDLLKKVQWGWLSLSFLFIVPEVVFKALRFQVLVKRLDSYLSFRDAADVYLSGQPLSTLTPSKLGDIVRVLGLSRWAKISLSTALSVHVADKVYDLLALGLLACVGVLDLFTITAKQNTAASILLGILLGVLLMGLFLHPGWMRSIVKPVLMSLAPKKLAAQLSTHGGEFYQKLQELFNPAERAALPFLISIGAWAIVVIRGYFCVLSLAVPIPLGPLALLLPVVIVIEFIPISVLGFGLREWALILLFSEYAPSSSLVSLGLLFLLTGPITAALLGVPAAVRLSSALPKKS